MGQVKKVKLKPVKKVKKKESSGISIPEDLSLPTEKSEPSTNMGDYTLLIYGRKKIGKTSLVSNFPKTFCMMFEPGGKSLRIYQKPVNNWEEFIGYIDLLENTKHDFKTVSIDTGKIAYECCFDYVCRREGFEHPQDEGYGKGWNKIKRELTGCLIRLMNLGMGVIIICHETIGDITRSTNDIYNRIHPDLSKQADDFFSAVIDTIGYYRYIGRQRVLQIEGNEDIAAGTRCEENFFTKSGERIVNIPMGNNAKEAYSNLLKAFNNKQETTGEEVAVVKTKAKVKLKKRR